MDKISLSELLNPSLPAVEQLNQQFTNALPFKFIVIDNFLAPTIADKILAQFPTFDPSRAINEHGNIGKKATRPDLRDISAFYAQIDDLIQSKEFLAYMSNLSGIPDLIYDAKYFGGGTHESCDGQELDVHIDFNYDAATKMYRRLNLLIYLNHDWQPEWGGNIEIHSNPRNYYENKITSFAPIFNRCMLFETHEHSWHGFDEINLPADKKNLTRKSLSIYFYAKQRPTKEEVPPHTTFYVQRPLPKHIKPGYTLTEKDCTHLLGLMFKRDHWITYYQNQEMAFNKTTLELQTALEYAKSSVRLPMHGYISQIGSVEGYWYDNWVGSIFSFTIVADMRLKGISISGYRPDLFPVSEATIEINGVKVQESIPLIPGQTSDITTPITAKAGEKVTIKMYVPSTFNPHKNNMGVDDRDLGLLLLRVTGIH